MLNVKQQRRYTYLFQESFSFHAYPSIVTSQYNTGVVKPTMLQYFDYYIDQEEKLVGNGKERSTIVTYQVRMRKLVEYLSYLDKMDIRPEEITIRWIREYETWMRSNGLSVNYTAKNLQLINTMLILARENKDITHNPFDLYKFRYNRDTNVEVLSLEELKLLASYKFANESLQIIAHGYVFCCFTGLAYVDADLFSRKTHVKQGPDNNPWIIFPRWKSKEETIVPLFPEAEKILNIYGDKIPIRSIQKMNKYIKECIEIVGIKKHITTHTARHTFGMLMHNEFGVSLESVSKMLGHKSVRTTQQFYVKTEIKKIIHDLGLKRSFFDAA